MSKNIDLLPQAFEHKMGFLREQKCNRDGVNRGNSENYSWKTNGMFL